jgi:cytochrome c oxidase assembly protein subunit 15
MMRAEPMTPGVRITRGHYTLLIAASALTCLLITLGGIVCVTGSAAGCPDWPGCYGRIVPPSQVNAVIEYVHRFIAALTTPFILAAAIVGWRRARMIRWVSRPPIIAIPFLLAVIVFGALAVLRGLPRGLAAVDLGSALIVLALMVAATAAAGLRRANPDLPDRLSIRDARLALGALAATFAVLVSGVLVAGSGSLTRCLGWPLARLMDYDLPGWPQAARLIVAALASVLILAVVVGAWHTPRKCPAYRTVATVAGALLLVEIGAGALMLAAGVTIALLAVSVASAAALWALLVVVGVLSGIRSG